MSHAIYISRIAYLFPAGSFSLLICIKYGFHEVPEFKTLENIETTDGNIKRRVLKSNITA
jgi:hypothetical protein